MVDFNLLNNFTRKRNELGHELTKEGTNIVTQQSMVDVRINEMFASWTDNQYVLEAAGKCVVNAMKLLRTIQQLVRNIIR